MPNMDFKFSFNIEKDLKVDIDDSFPPKTSQNSIEGISQTGHRKIRVTANGPIKVNLDDLHVIIIQESDKNRTTALREKVKLVVIKTPDDKYENIKDILKYRINLPSKSSTSSSEKPQKYPQQTESEWLPLDKAKFLLLKDLLINQFGTNIDRITVDGQVAESIEFKFDTSGKPEKCNVQPQDLQIWIGEQ